MSISRSVVATTFGLLFMVGCGGEKSGGGTGDPGDPSSDGGTQATKGGAGNSASNTSTGGKNNGTNGTNHAAGSNNSAGNNSGVGSSTSNAGNNSGVGSSTSNAGNNSGTGANNGNGGSGNTVGGAANTVGGSGNTQDPPKTSVGGSGNTQDPPKTSTGGSGNTQDPVGGNGSTGDPVGGSGNTGDPVGGKGNTGDPVGGTGNTGDPTGGKGNTGDPVGGSGNTGDPPKDCVPAEMNKINVIVFDDASPSGADSEGGMYVGGNLTTSGYSIGAGAEANLTCSDWGLVVGGSIVGSVYVKAGKVAYTGTATGTTSTCGKTRANPIDFTALETKFIAYSTAFKNYPANGTASGSLVLTGSRTDLNVFNITGAQLTSASRIEFKVPVASSVIVNVSGTTINWSGMGFLLPDGGVACRGSNGAETGCERILWNFYEATSISLSGIGVQGTILAPYAEQSGAGGNVDGQVIVKSLTGGIEYHPYYFTGCLVLPTL